jgi:hypothetical protein
MVLGMVELMIIGSVNVDMVQQNVIFLYLVYVQCSGCCTWW